MKLLLSPKAKYLAITIISVVACYILLFVYTEINPPEIDNSPDKSPQKTAIFFTDVFPKKIIWIDEDDILVQEDSQVTIYSIQNRKSRTIYENPKDSELVTIKNSWWTNTKILIATEGKDETHILQYNLNGDKLKQQTQENYDFIETENDLICNTQNFIIKSPDEIATEIQIKPLHQEKNEETILLKTLLTVKPLNCSKDKLILIPSNPVLEKKIYSWDPNKTKPEQIDLPADTTDIINQSPITDSNDIFYLEKEDPTSNIYQIHSTKFNDPNLSTTIKTFTSDENFLNIYPNNTRTSFALISERGELWILHTKEK